MAAQGSAPSEAAQTTWYRNVYNRQKSRMTPEIAAAIQSKAEKSRRRAQRSKKASRMVRVQKANISSYVTNSVAMLSSVTPAAWASRAKAAEDEMGALQQALEEVDEADDDAFELQIASAAPAAPLGPGQEAYAGLLGGGEPLTGALPPPPVAATEDAAFQALLDKLRVEPTDAAELGAKFKLYESFLDTVQLMRKKTLDFWDECAEDFVDAPTVVAAVEASIKSIDDHGNMAIGESAGRWFVYDMTVQASRNNDTLGRVLGDINTKLELLGRQEECPICLEAIADPAAPADATPPKEPAAGGTDGGDDDEGTTLPPHVLGCCHKVCGRCWEQWTALKGAGAPCPLCRHEDFLADIVHGHAVPQPLFDTIVAEEPLEECAVAE